MINHFRTLLLNITDSGDPAMFISPGFHSRTLSNKVNSVYLLLFPVGSTEQRCLSLGQAYLELLNSAGIEEVVYLQDPRISYDLEKDFNNFKTASLDLSRMIETMRVNTKLIKEMLSSHSVINTTKYNNMYLEHPNPVYRLAGLIAAYTLRLT